MRGRCEHRRAVGERLHRLLVDRGRARAVLQEALADLVVVRGAHQAGGGGELVALALRVAAARLDDVAHARPFVEPGLVVAELVLQRAADAVDLVDLGAAPGRGGEAEQQPHRPAVVGREIDEGRIVFSVAHGSSLAICLGRELATQAVSCSAKAGHPVTTAHAEMARSCQDRAAMVTGSPAFAGDDSRVVVLPSTGHSQGHRHARQIQDPARGSTCSSTWPTWKRPACSSASTGRSTRTPSSSRWCAGSSSAACRRTERRAFLFTNVIDAKGRRYDMPVVVGALASSPAIYAIGMGRPVGRDRRRLDAGDRATRSRRSRPTTRRARRWWSPATRCAREGLKRLPVPVSTPGFDAAPYLTATLCVTRIPRAACATWAPIASR